LQKPLGSHDFGIRKLLDEVVKSLFPAHLNLCPEASLRWTPEVGQNFALP
jgi:hypothetical protein